MSAAGWARRSRMLITSVAAVALAHAPAALAANIDGDALRFVAEAGETNTVTIDADAADRLATGAYTKVTVTDTTAPLTATNGCQSVGPHTATCTKSYGFTSVDIQLGDGDDAATVGPLGSTGIFGGPGNDVLTGSDGGNDLFKGGTGDDTISGRGGNDRLDDMWFETAEEVQGGSDTYSGGAGSDQLHYKARTAAVSITLDGVANDGELGEHDNVAADVETLAGGSGNDFIGGGTGAELLIGNDGDDRIVGGGGNDGLEGGLGADRIDAGPGDDLIDGDLASLGADDVHGGAGVDKFVSNESGAVTISLDDAANDGSAAQNIHSDVENVTVNTRATVWGSAAANDLRVRKPELEFCFPGGSAPGTELHGRAGNDTLTAYGADDRLYGDDGADTIDGGCGTDYISGGTGIDVIQAQDGDPTDVVSCGGGVDRVTADAGDRVAKDCELVIRVRLPV
jgi:Ca2+-binding RTX toxin-like protein